MILAFQLTPALGMFLAFVAVTLVITYFSARKATGTTAYFAAGRSIKGWQNGLAVAGDYMSAASFLGISGMIAFFGYDHAACAGRFRLNQGKGPPDFGRGPLLDTGALVMLNVRDPLDGGQGGMPE